MYIAERTAITVVNMSLDKSTKIPIHPGMNVNALDGIAKTGMLYYSDFSGSQILQYNTTTQETSIVSLNWVKEILTVGVCLALSLMKYCNHEHQDVHIQLE